MKEKIAFPQLVELVAAKASTTSRMSELFVQELFATVAQALGDGQSVKIKGIGTFKVKKDNSGKDVEFIPDKALSQAVNAPFEQFKPVELCDEVTDEQLAEIDASMEPAPNPEPAPQQVEPSVIEPVEENVPNNDNIQEETEKEMHEEVPSNKEEQPLPLESTSVETEAIKPSSRIKWISIAAAIAAIALIAGIVIHNTGKDNKEIVAKTDSIASPKPQPVVTDTLRTDYRLFDMAQRHYGDQAFWVYIALENQKQFPNYRKIPKGSALVIPPAAKYGINSDSKQSLRNAATEAFKLSKLRKQLEKEQGENTDKKSHENLDKSVEPAKDKKKDKNNDESTIKEEKKEEKKDKKNKKDEESDDKAPINESSTQESTKSHKSSHYKYHKYH